MTQQSRYNGIEAINQRLIFKDLLHIDQLYKKETNPIVKTALLKLKHAIILMDHKGRYQYDNFKN
jgi:hypothetical protein